MCILFTALHNMKHTELSIFFDSLASKILIYAVGVLPMFFLPFFGSSVQSVKAYILSIAVVLVFIFWLLGRIYDKKLTIPRSRTLLVFFILSIWTLIASFFSRSFSLSFFGRGFEFGTAVTFWLSLLILFFSIVYITTSEKIKKVFSLFLISTAIVLLWQCTTLFFSPGVSFLGIPFGVFTTLYGSWGDFVILSGIAVLLSSIFLTKLPLKKPQKIFCYSVFALALLFLVLGGNYFLSIIVLLASLVIFIFEMNINIFISKKDSIQKFPLVSAITVVVLLFSLSFPLIITSIRNSTHTHTLEVTPTTSFTFHVFKETFKNNPLFGVGPNNFDKAWMQYRPLTVDTTKFSDVAFVSGFSTVSTFFVTYGLIGGILIFLFFVFCLLSCRKIYFYLKKQQVDFWFFKTLIFFICFLIFLSLTINVGFVTWIYLIVFIGSLIGIHKDILLKESFVFKLDSFNKKVAKVFLSLIVLFCLLLVSFVFFITKKTIALGFAEYSNRMMKVDLLKAEKGLNRALFFDKNDLYYKNLLKLYSDRIEGLITNPPDATKETIKNTYEKLFNDAILSGERAYEIDSQSLDTLLLFARLYQMAIPLGREDAYTKSIEYFKQIDILFPKNQTILLSMAKTEFLFNNTSQAAQYVEDALRIRNDNPDAYILGARILYQAKNTEGAKEYLNRGLLVMPTNATLLFNYGLIEFTDKEYEKALPYFEQSLLSNPDSTPTRYYFGVTYFRLDKKDRALEQFKILQTQYPENKTIKILLSNIENNKDVLTGINQAVLDPITDSLK